VRPHAASGDLFQDGIGVLPHGRNLPQVERPAHGGPVPLAEQRPDVPPETRDGGVASRWIDRRTGTAACGSRTAAPAGPSGAANAASCWRTPASTSGAPAVRPSHTSASSRSRSPRMVQAAGLCGVTGVALVSMKLGPAVIPGACDPTGSLVSNSPSGRMTWRIISTAVSPSMLSSASVSSVWWKMRYSSCSIVA